MSTSREFRELLAADAALMLGVAEARDVAAALQRYWDRREESGVSFEAELRHIAGLDEAAVARVRAEVERLLGRAGGDAKVALTRHGGLDRSIHVALDKGEGNLTRALSVLGVQVRAPLRPLPTDRYVDFQVAGVGGMGVVYAALDTEMNRRVAFKMIRADAEGGKGPGSPMEATRPDKESPESEVFEQLKARLVQEAWVTGGLEHPGIVPVYEIGQTSAGIPYYTMRYVRGERTLADAIREKKDAPFEERLALLEPFLRVCDTLRYAHDKGVVHRDLKPANVALGNYGEVVLLDWGLARLEGKEDVASSAWQRQVETMRQDAGFHTQAGGALGTAGYMAPEAALGRLAEVDQRSDVYSLGAMLFEILTGRLPFEFRSYAEYASLLLRKDPPEARSVNAPVPEALSALCARALSREKDARPASASELADAVRAWQVQDAVEREIEALLRDASSALGSAEGLEGEARLGQVDRAAAALARVETKRPDSGRAKALGARARALREQGIRQRERASARRVLRRVGVGALVVAAVAAFVVVTVVEGKRKEAENARAATQVALGEKAAALETAERERNEKAEALIQVQRERDQVLRLADSKRVRDLVDEVGRLWPLVPDRAAAMAAWMEGAKAVLANREDHRTRLAAIRERALPYDDEQRERDHAGERARIEAGRRRLEEIDAAGTVLTGEDVEEQRKALAEQATRIREEILRLEAGLAERRTWAFTDAQADWQHQVVVDLLAGFDFLDGGGEGDGALARVQQRHDFVTTLHKASIEDHKQAWDEAIAGVAASPKYGGVHITPQLGLVPLGPDPDSGLFEFAHRGSGSMPERDPETKRLAYTDDAAIVLVLIPGGTFTMGAQKEDPEGPNYDPAAEGDESPVHEVTLSPFFLAKHECTQAQWMAMTEGEDPSRYKAGATLGEEGLTSRNPVERVSWEDCLGDPGWLTRNRLTLPSEAQWEYACRAGTDTPWIPGRDIAALGTVANIADAWLKGHGGETFAVTPEVDDGHSAHAPVGSFAANGFGLHDVHGNVWEWCRDAYRTYGSEPVSDPVFEGSGDRVYRGGSWLNVARYARCAYRNGYAPGYRSNSLGVRPARPLLLE